MGFSLTLHLCGARHRAQSSVCLAYYVLVTYRPCRVPFECAYSHTHTHAHMQEYVCTHIPHPPILPHETNSKTLRKV